MLSNNFNLQVSKNDDDILNLMIYNSLLINDIIIIIKEKIMLLDIKNKWDEYLLGLILKNNFRKLLLTYFAVNSVKIQLIVLLQLDITKQKSFHYKINFIMVSKQYPQELLKSRIKATYFPED